MAEETREDTEARTAARAREVNEARNKTRVERLAEIADNNDAMHAAEMVETPDGNLKHVPDEAEETEAAAAREAEEAERALAEAAARVLQEQTEPEAQGAAPDSETKPELVSRETTEERADVKVVNGITHYLTVVNGTEKWLTLDQLRTVAQKVESADEYLAAAAESVKKAARLDLSPKGDEPSKVEKVDLEKLLRSVSMGDEDAIKTLASELERLREAPAKSSVPTDAWQQIDDRLAFRRAVDWFEDEYQDVLGDAILKRAVYERDAELAKEPQQGSGYAYYKGRLKKAGEEIRTWLKTKSPTPAEKPKTTTASVSSTKEAAKRALPSVPSAAARQPGPAEEEPEETTEQVIQKIAQARGQGRATVHRPGQR